MLKVGVAPGTTTLRLNGATMRLTQGNTMLGVVDPHSYNTTASSSGARGIGESSNDGARAWGAGIMLSIFLLLVSYGVGRDAGWQACNRDSYRRW